MKPYAVVCLLAVMVLGAVPFAVAAQSDPAGKVVFAKGEVKAVDATGGGRYLIRDDRVLVGDTIVTKEGRVQIRFTDGGMVSVKANTEYRIASYVYRDGLDDGSETSFFDLVKGAVRFVSGAIGKKNPNRFRISTTTATIGIRGTAASVENCIGGSCGERPDGTYISGYDGIVTIASGSFRGEVRSGENFYCDGETCTNLADNSGPNVTDPVIPDLQPNYRQGDQHHIDPGHSSPGHSY